MLPKEPVPTYVIPWPFGLGQHALHHAALHDDTWSRELHGSKLPRWWRCGREAAGHSPLFWPAQKVRNPRCLTPGRAPAKPPRGRGAPAQGNRWLLIKPRGLAAERKAALCPDYTQNYPSSPLSPRQRLTRSCRDPDAALSVAHGLKRRRFAGHGCLPAAAELRAGQPQYFRSVVSLRVLLL